jgi:hypothetical protein
MISRSALMLAAGSLFCQAANAQVYGGCRFDKATLRFAGTVEETTRCLLRKVKAKGAGATAQSVPQALLDWVTRPVNITAAQLTAYLSGQDIADQRPGARRCAAGPLLRDTRHELAGGAGREVPGQHR